MERPRGSAGHPRRCVAKKRNGKQCKSFAVTGATTCRMHLGTSNRNKGLAHHNTASGRYSTHAPTRLAGHMEAFTNAVASGQYLVLADDISLANALVVDALERLDTGEGKRRAVLIRDSWREFRDATASGDREAIGKIANRLDRLVSEDASYFDALDQVHKAQRQKVHIVEAERKRIKDGQEMMSTIEAYAFMSNVLSAVRRHVSDPDILTEIGNEVANAATAFAR